MSFSGKPDKPKRGRPKKKFDVGLAFHMLKNKASIAAVARHVNVHRDTLYANYRPLIEAARIAHREAWKIIADERFRQFLEKERLKEEAKRKKRRDRRAIYYGR